MVVTKTIYCVAVEDLDGNIDTAAFEDYNDTIFLGGYTDEGEYVTFDSEARHLSCWCEQNDFSLYQGEEEIEFFLEAE